MGDAVTKKVHDVIEKPTRAVVSPELVCDTLLAPAMVGGKEAEQELIEETDNSISTNSTSGICASKLLVVDSPDFIPSQRCSVLRPPCPSLKPPDQVSLPPPPLPSKPPGRDPLLPLPSKPPDRYSPSHLHMACKVQSEILNPYVLHGTKPVNALVFDFHGATEICDCGTKPVPPPKPPYLYFKGVHSTQSPPPLLQPPLLPSPKPPDPCVHRLSREFQLVNYGMFPANLIPTTQNHFPPSDLQPVRKKESQPSTTNTLGVRYSEGIVFSHVLSSAHSVTAYLMPAVLPIFSQPSLNTATSHVFYSLISIDSFITIAVSNPLSESFNDLFPFDHVTSMPFHIISQMPFKLHGIIHSNNIGPIFNILYWQTTPNSLKASFTWSFVDILFLCKSQRSSSFYPQVCASCFPFNVCGFGIVGKYYSGDQRLPMGMLITQSFATFVIICSDLAQHENMIKGHSALDIDAPKLSRIEPRNIFMSTNGFDFMDQRHCTLNFLVIGVATWKQWDPGDQILASRRVGPLCFKQWDPGKLDFASIFFNLEDKVDVKGNGM